MTQAAQLIAELRRGWRTWGDLQATRISTCPWKRLSEAGHKYLRDGEKIAQKTGSDGLLRLRVAKG